MEIDSSQQKDQKQQEPENQSDIDSIKESLQTMAKAMEILQSVYNSVSADSKIRVKITKTFEDIVNMSDYFKFLQTLHSLFPELSSTPTLMQSTLSMMNAIVTHIFIYYKDQDPKKQIKEKSLVTNVITLSVFWTFTLSLSNQKEFPAKSSIESNISNISSKPEEAKLSASQNSSSSSTVKTRLQLKKEGNPPIDKTSSLQQRRSQLA